ncbi:phosphoribosylanthranilate isomerase [Paraburkholderia sp. GAS42]|uniref:phosphoribosylanthranilate isomerase n=1 Tax=Paraburkholderia sp. GAS42 TaxID=3035135 RepID=UPI003D1E96C2
MDPFIKVCGIQTIEEALGAVDAGANTIGLLLGISSVVRDRIRIETGQKVVDAIPKRVRSVMVTNLLDLIAISTIAKFVGVSAIQIHGELPVTEIGKLRLLLPDVELIKAVHVVNNEALMEAIGYAPHVDMLLLDSGTQDGLGGTGQIHDWGVSRAIVRAVELPVILAGGLNPENISAAIEKVDPAGIDANSGLEHPDGRKDFEKIRAFAKAGRRLLKPWQAQKKS